MLESPHAEYDSKDCNQNEAAALDYAARQYACHKNVSHEERRQKQKTTERDQSFVGYQDRSALRGCVRGATGRAVANAEVEVEEQADHQPHEEAHPVFDRQTGHEDKA